MDDDLTRAVKQFAPNAFEAKSPSGSGKSSGGSNSNRAGDDELTGAVRQFAPELYGGDSSSGKKAGQSNKEKIANIRRLAPNVVREVFRENEIKQMDLVDKGKEKITEEDLVEIPAEQFQQEAAGTRERVRHNVHGLIQEVLEEIRRPETWLDVEVIDSYLDRITFNRQDIAFVPGYVIEQFRRERRIAPNWLERIQNLHQIRLFFVPVHLHGNHWALAVWDRTTNAIEVFDSLIMDETLEEKLQFVDLLEEFFKDFCTQKELSWKQPKFDPLVEVPQQPNGYDCGVFTLMFAHYIARDGHLDASEFRRSKVDAFREKIYRELRDIYFPQSARSRSTGSLERGASAHPPRRSPSKSQGKRSRSRSGSGKRSPGAKGGPDRKRSNSQNLERTSSGRYIPAKPAKGDRKSPSKSGGRKDRGRSPSRSGSRSGSRSHSRSASGGSRSRSGSRSGSGGRRETKSAKKSSGKPSKAGQHSQNPDSQIGANSGKSGDKKQKSSRNDRSDRNKSRSADRSRSRSGSRSGSRSMSESSRSRSASGGRRSGSRRGGTRSGSRDSSGYRRSGSGSVHGKHTKRSKHHRHHRRHRTEPKQSTAFQQSPPVLFDGREQSQRTRMPMDYKQLKLRDYNIRAGDYQRAGLVEKFPMMSDEEFKRIAEKKHIFGGIGHRIDKTYKGATYYVCTKVGSCYGRLTVFQNKHFRRTALHTCDEARPAMARPVQGRVCLKPVPKEQQYKVDLNCADENNIPLNIWAKHMPKGRECLDFVADVQYCRGKFHFEVGVGKKKSITFDVPEAELNVTNVLVTQKENN